MFSVNSYYNYLVKENYLENFDHILNNYPVEQIMSYCANPSVSEHKSSLDGNFSAPVLDNQFTQHVEHILLPEVKTQFLGNDWSHDHHYCNYHYDLPNSSLGVHNDYKNFRWLITCQLYLDNTSEGVRLLNLDGSVHKRLPCNYNMFYCLEASPYSWHDVPELTQHKHTILFRVGKKRFKTCAHPQSGKPAWVIVNDNHCDKHYAKLGPRMGNLTEAWLVNAGEGNIYHTDWRADPEKTIKIARHNHEIVHVINSGDFGTHKYRITDQNYLNVAEVVFQRNTDIPIIVQAEEILMEYTAERQHLNYLSL